MKNILAIWIIWQLIIVGIAGGAMHYNEKKCIKIDTKSERYEYMIVGAFIPLSVFTYPPDYTHCNFPDN